MKKESVGQKGLLTHPHISAATLRDRDSVI